MQGLGCDYIGVQFSIAHLTVVADSRVKVDVALSVQWQHICNIICFLYIYINIYLYIYCLGVETGLQNQPS